MRKIFIAALMVAGLAVQGMAADQPITLSFSIEQAESASIDRGLIDKILHQVEKESSYDYQCLCDKYDQGELTIQKDIQGYRVAINDGGVCVEIIIDGL